MTEALDARRLGAASESREHLRPPDSGQRCYWRQTVGRRSRRSCLQVSDCLVNGYVMFEPHLTEASVSYGSHLNSRVSSYGPSALKVV